jgi:hypothetical protein
MVVGVYALAYARAAWRPAEASFLIALGLLGKVLEPLGWLAAVAAGELPSRTFPLILLNDLIWWFPFLLYLLRDLPKRRRVVAWVVVVVHVVACVALLLVRGGTEIVPDMAERHRWVAAHAPLWVATWLLWALASMSLAAFTFVWTARLLELGAPRRWAMLGCAVVTAGVFFDLAGESVNVVWLTAPGQTVTEFARGARLYGVLSAAIANGLYCVGGLLLSALAWRVGWLRGGVGVLGFAMWGVGLALTVAAVHDNGPAMVVSGGGVMALYVPWAALVGWRLGEMGESRRTSA